MTPGTRWRLFAVLVAGVLVMAGYVAAAPPAGQFAGPGAPESTTIRSPAPPVPETATYTFDTVGPGATFAATSGRAPRLRALVRYGAKLRTVAHGSGKAIQFPPACTRRRCPRLALHAASTPALNPATRPIRYGATVRLAPGQTSDGQNVLQKGYSVTGGQYKLQVDKLPGHPSCAMTSEGSSTIHLATSRVTVADNTWHALECRRSGTTLTILVDGQVRGSTTVPAALTVDNSAPLVLGGKGLSADSDPFQGALDDAWISVAA